VVEIARRDNRSKSTVPLDGIATYIQSLLENIQSSMFDKARKFRDAHITEVNSKEEFISVLDERGGFISAHWDGTPETEEAIKDITKATIRCIPLQNKLETGVCVWTGNPSKQRVLFARAY
jgi:prolyl-tRNA synthetase